MTASFGFVNALKPVGISSAAFGSWVKRLAKASAVGHWGTLDPTAAGVLVLAVGRATRLLPLLSDARKQYVFELVMGTKTDSGDRTGQVIQSAYVPADWRLRLPLALTALVGAIKQTPPMHSALKVKGRPLYSRARAGIEIPRAPREVRIHVLRQLSDAAPGASSGTARHTSGPTGSDYTARLFVECDAGTYVRVLCEDIGLQLGLPAHMGMLVRVAAGTFTIKDSVAPAAIAEAIENTILNPLTILTQRRIELDTGSARRFVHGNEIVVPDAPASEDEVLAVHEGRLLGSGSTFSRDGHVMLAPVRVIATPAELP